VTTPKVWADASETPAPPEDAHVRVALLESLYRQALPAGAISVIVVALLCAGIWDAADHFRLRAWFAATCVATLVRYAAIFGFYRYRSRADTATWERWFLITLLVSALVWGIGALIVLPHDSPFHQALVYVFLVGLAGGMVALYSAHQTGAIVSAIASLAPTTLWLALQPDFQLRVLAFAGILFLATAARAIHGLGGLIRQSFRLASELELARKAAEHLARTDSLTGILNRRAFYELGDFVVEQSKRHGRPPALLLIDIDRFKTVNDRYGHAAGDSALRALAAVLQATCRKIDVVGRLGGDEFAVLLPDATLEGALALAERLRTELAVLRVHDHGSEIELTCSVGAAGGELVDSLDQLARRSDNALYEAKSRGRNQVAR
jgi:diguanylate cyclase (GGDEF)-like protein